MISPKLVASGSSLIQCSPFAFRVLNKINSPTIWCSTWYCDTDTSLVENHTPILTPDSANQK